VSNKKVRAHSSKARRRAIDKGGGIFMSASKKWRTKRDTKSEAGEGACKPLIGHKLTGKSETEIISSICGVV